MEERNCVELSYSDTFGGKKLLYSSGNITFHHQGIMLIIGDNGVGKSTLLRQFFQDNREASILVEQNVNYIFSNLSIIENLCMYQELYTEDEVKEILTQYGFAKILDKNPKKLSGGEKKLITILRGLFSDAHYILLDEPTNDLSYDTINSLIELLKEDKKR